MTDTTSAGTAPRHPLLRQLATQAAADPRIEQAVLGAIRQVLPEVIESILQQRFPGETVRLYARKGPSRERRDERDRQIRAAAASGLPVAAIAARFSITERRVRQVLALLGPA